MNQSSSRNRPKSGARRTRTRSQNRDTSKPVSKLTMQRVSRLFVGCPRCGFFLSGYRARLGVERLQAAVDQVQNVERDWLVLGWQHNMLELLERSYGCEVQNDTIHFEERCGECGRVLVLEQAADDEKSLRIQVMPRIRYLNRS